MTEKEKFYVFSGIEHTLMGKEYIDKYYGPAGMQFGYVKTDETCMNALNYLLAKLEEKYDTVLVITSNKRSCQESCLSYLDYNGLKYDKPIFFTKFVAGERGEKIVDFLEHQNASPLAFHTAPLYVKLIKYFKDNPDFKNYVVLDEPKREISKYIPASQYKKVSKKKGLSRQDADEILIANGIEPTMIEAEADSTPAQNA